MMTPCMVNSGCTSADCEQALRHDQVQSHQGGGHAADEEEDRDRAENNSAMRLWSRVSSHEAMVFSVVR